ncbi:tripartite tricarboxylate transporter substrate binding protein [Verticiella sediminum]|uniref:Tripartite tricarboxylate transporter substrate binding protein n=1 Tax=Verticiella sediminum TaxID=1247510 RepID=A0A556AJ24_9BURK|nr:tripartite tricarboxylate transporter substrate binding protein [Verticiella sediminum]TSH92902.1 tripartite tricarboxylate transporter substrate binding protein [Verticiella sediminum]
MKVRIFLATITATIMPLAAAAQSIQTRIIVPFAAGGATDTVARSLASKLSQTWNETVMVENRPGAAGTIGARHVATSPPDGRTLLIVASGHAINELVHEKLPYRTVEDFTPVAQVVDVPNVLLAPKNSPYASVMDVVAAAKENPNLLSYGTSGVGTSVHLSGELLKSMSGVNIEAIFFKGDAESLTNVVGGHVPLSINTVPGAKEQIDAGNVRALAVTAKTRVPVIEHVPTIDESGVPGYDVSTWFGILGPKDMDPALVERLNADIRDAMHSPEIDRQLSERGMIIQVGTPAEFDRLIRDEIGKWKPIVEELGLRGKS